MNTLRVAFVAALSLTVGCSMWPFEREQDVPLDQVPEPVRSAALRAVPGLQLSEASLEREGGADVYELEGRADGQEVEVEVSADGRVLEVERD